MEAYLDAFNNSDEPFLYHWRMKQQDGRKGSTPRLSCSVLTRGAFLLLARQAATRLTAAGASKGSRVLHYFSANQATDLIFRVGAMLIGAVPVTVNWQADLPDRVLFKATASDAVCCLHDKGTPEAVLTMLASRTALVQILASVEELQHLVPAELVPTKEEDATKLIIFTSGTTGRPKGVKLTYKNYSSNRATFESFLRLDGVNAAATRLVVVVTNPLHHTNSTAMTDWALRRPGAACHLIERYTTDYWRVLAHVASSAVKLSESVPDTPPPRVVAPLVSRHFDFLEALALPPPADAGDASAARSLTLPLAELCSALRYVTVLLGSAPVGPTTVRRLQKYAGRLPVVRFGSTETCLQVVGTPFGATDEHRLRAFERGWAHTWRGAPCAGYYIGRDHAPHTCVKVVLSVDPSDEARYMRECAEGEPGKLIVCGGNVMSGYLDDVPATAKALHRDVGLLSAAGGDTWYTNLGGCSFPSAHPHCTIARGSSRRLGCGWIAGDQCFWLSPHETVGAPSTAQQVKEIYWQSRDSNLLIRGGANYASGAL